MKSQVNVKKNLIKIGCTFGMTLALLMNTSINGALYGGNIVKAATNTASQTAGSSIDTSSLDLAEVRYLIQNAYVDKVPDSVLNLPSIDAIIKALNVNDPYTAYFTANEANDFVGKINNNYSGIGVYIDTDPKGIKVTGVMDGSPAQEVGIEAGDIITKAAGHSLAGLSTEEAVQYVKGPENTTVAIEVLRDNKTNNFIVARKSINAPTVQGDILNDHTAYIDISSFGDNTPTEFKSQLDKLKKSNPDSYIIDLRDNGGGYTTSAYNIAGYFMGSKPVVRLVDRNNEVYMVDAIAQAETIDKPTIFLVNENTASASEILSAAVKDYKDAFFIGTTTYGKGCAQDMFQLSDGSVLKLTVMRFYSPNGNTIQKVGITPNLNVGDNIDSLGVALLLSGNSGNTLDKSGYIRVRVSNQYFEVNLTTAEQSEYKDAMNYILNKCDSNEIYVGTANGWQKTTLNDVNSLLK